MKKIILITLLFTSFNSFAHKDKILYENYGNITLYLRTGFENSEFEKIKVIGKLSEKISESLKFKDTILIEYIQDYTDQYSDDLYMLEYGNSNFKLINGLKSKYVIKPFKKGIAVRIYADRINVSNILKLVEFCIVNKESTNSYLTEKSIGYNFEEDQVLLESFNSIATEDEVIDKIFSSESEIIKQIISDKVMVQSQDHYGMEIYWHNNKFVFSYKHWPADKKEMVFEIEDFFHHQIINTNDAIIFTDKFEFYYLDSTKANEKRTLDLVMPIYAPIIVKSYGNKLLLASSYNPSSINIYLIDKNKVITEFD